MEKKVVGLSGDHEDAESRRKEVAQKFREFADKIESGGGMPTGVLIQVHWGHRSCSTVRKQFDGFNIVEAIGALHIEAQMLMSAVDRSPMETV